MAVARRQYTAEFKQEAVRLVEVGGLSQTARQLGVNRNLLSKWRRRLAQAPSVQAAGPSRYVAFPGSGHAHDEEMARLRRENAALKLERDILKKAISIFAEPAPR